jgi:hypothetical protein
MSQRASLRRFRPFHTLAVGLALAGCIQIGGSDGSSDDDDDAECEIDDDCPGTEVCNDGTCESLGSGGTGGRGGSGGTTTGGRGGSITGGSSSGGSATGGSSSGGSITGGSSSGGSATGGSGGSGGSCNWICDFGVGCGTTTADECLSQCWSLYTMGGACSAAMDALAECAHDYGSDCAGGQMACGPLASAADSECVACEWTGDGECDEPEGTGLCLEGSDVEDCSGVPPCVRGSSGNTCEWACDDECDEAAGTDLCPAGTDTYDCTNY